MVLTTLAFVDDHPILLSGVCQIFSSSDEFRVIAVGETAEDAVEIANTARPDIIVLDLGMPGSVTDAIKTISQLNQNKNRLVAFTASSSIDTAIETLEAGALGYVLKGGTLSELTDAIRTVKQGDSYVTPSLSVRMMDRLRKASRPRISTGVRFSRREEDVLRLLLRGCTNKEIANALEISEKTVKHYMTVLIQKLQVRNRVEVVLAVQEMVVSGDLPNGFHLN